ncbi:MAG: proline racemase family protein [Candidatus Aminicenantes bacterium]
MDAHPEGEPLRIITEGFPRLLGRSILKKRAFIRDNFDHLGTAPITGKNKLLIGPGDPLKHGIFLR